MDEAGRIYRDGQYLTSCVTAPADYNNLDKIDEGYFVNTGAAGENIDFSVIQGSVEASNIDMVQEMADMIASSRNFQSCSRIIKVFDEIMDMAANQVGRL